MLHDWRQRQTAHRSRAQNGERGARVHPHVECCSVLAPVLNIDQQYSYACDKWTHIECVYATHWLDSNGFVRHRQASIGPVVPIKQTNKQTKHAELQKAERLCVCTSWILNLSSHLILQRSPVHIHAERTNAYLHVQTRTRTALHQFRMLS